MKKALFSILALGYSMVTLAQAPTTAAADARRADKEHRKEAKIKQHGDDDDHDADHDGDKAGASTRRADKAAKERRKEAKTKQHGDDDDRTGDQAGKPANHGQNVSAFAKSTTLTGADKGAAISSVARGGHGVDHDMGNARSARGGERGHGGRPAGSGHQGGGHSMGGGHHGKH
ncbi:hypothetical protein [Hymenobacter antarcticus]|uniref:Uncharacterized protein n=1 Tax=Hymenobacter antarcticus TaxID=486270 RepID=A0ABP7PNU7_9BACT